MYVTHLNLYPKAEENEDKVWVFLKVILIKRKANKQNTALWAHNQASLGNSTRFIMGGQKKEETQIWVSNGMRMEGVDLGGVRGLGVTSTKAHSGKLSNNQSMNQ